MRKTFLSLCFVALVSFSFGQARLVLNNDVRMVIDANAWVVVENPNANAIISTPSPTTTGGSIVSESEFDRLRWQIGNTAGGYTVPFATPANEKIPLTYVKTGGAGPAASVIFSTYNYGASAPAWNNFNYRPSDVTHMNNFTTGTGFTPGATNQSGHVVDRFWIVDTKATGFSYATNPDFQLTFVYPQSEVMIGNTITGVSELLAQRFNSATNKWGDYIPNHQWTLLAFPLRNSVLTPGGPGFNPGAQFYRSWTLSDIADPLPIELTDFQANCQNSQVVVSWTTATETNNDYYTIQRSQNGEDWVAIGTVDGAGISVENITYTFVDIAPLGLAYYRLIQTDFDGSWSSSNMVAGGCEAHGGIEIVNVFDDGTDVNILVSSSFDAVHDVTLLDAQGKIMVVKNSQTIHTGITHLRIPKNSIAMGIYVVRLSNSDQVLTSRVVLK